MNITSSLSLLICGDICPTYLTRPLFDTRCPEAVFGNLTPSIATADVALANLECVLSDTASPADKIGPVLKGRTSDAKLLAAAGFDLVGIANNHIKDCGSAGVLDTISACCSAGITTTGGGRDAAAATQPAIIEKRGWRIGIMAMSEHEFNAAGPNSAGAHIFDPIEDLERLRALKIDCDYVIVLYHGGIEYHPFPSPLLQRTCRALIRNGADLVLCQHSHVVGTFEAFEGGHILYGQGNTVFGYRAGKPSWNEGLVVTVGLERGETPITHIELVPICCDPSGRIGRMAPEAARTCLEALNARSAQAREPHFIESAWAEFCRHLGTNQIPHALGFGLWLTRANRLLGGRLVNLLYGRRQQMTALNVIRCAAHREVVETCYDQLLYSTRSRASGP